MALQHLKLHPLTGNSDHDTTGLVNGQIVYVQNPTNGVQSTGMYADGSGGLTATTASITTLSAGTMISGSTNLYNIFLTAGQLSGTTVTAGSNISVSTSGTNYTVSVVPSPSFNNLTASGATSLQTLSATTMISGSTNIDSLFVKGVSAGSNTTIGGSSQYPSVSVVASPLFNNLTASGATSLQTLSATTMISGSTNLYQIFQTAGSGVQSVGATGNAQTGGTATNPVISIVASPSFNNLTVSGTGNFTGVLQSGGTNLGNIFVDGSGTTGRLPLWLNGVRTLTDSIIAQNGTGVTVNGSVNILGDVTILGTATTINTQTIQSLDNNILLNYSGNHVSAIGGGITVLSGTPSGVASVWATDANGAWSSNTAIITTAITVNGGNIAVTGGGAMTSGGTNLYNIFASAGSGVQSVGANGNLSTGGTVTNPTIILAASPSFNNVTYSGTSTGGNSIAVNVSATTLFSGSTNVDSLFVKGVSAGSNTTIGGSSQYPTVNVVASPSFNSITASGATSLQTVSATTMISGSTNLYQIFATAGSGVQSVGATGNAQTGGTATNPVISIVASPSFNSITASGATSLQTLSATTMISGSTNLYQIFAPLGTSGVQSVGATGNIQTGGTTLNPVISIVASPSFNNVTYSGTSTGGNSIATNVSGTTLFSGSTNVGTLFVNTISNGTNTTVGGSANHRTVNLVDSPSFNSITASGATSLQTVSATTMISGSTNLYQIFATAGSGVQSVGATGNAQTGGTATNPVISIVASPSFNNVTYSGVSTGGSSIAVNVSATTLFSGSTNVDSLFVKGVVAGSNTTIGGSSQYPSVSVVASPSFNNLTASGATSLQTVSATTMISGSTNLYQIFATAGSGVQTVTAGSNIVVGGTVTNPTVSLAASPSVNGLTVSGTGNFTGILQSGGTNLGNIFVDGSGTTNKIPLWLNGVRTLTDSIMTQSGITVAGSVNIIGNVNVLGTATTFNTQTVQSQDNNILLNFSGSYVSALGGGITVLSGTPSGVASTWSIDANGAWSANTAILTSAITVNGGNIAVTGGGAMTSGGTNLYNIFATAGQDFTTASNGLTKSGYNVTLGGTLTAATTVVLGGNALQLSGEGASSTTVAWSGAPYYTRLLVNGNGSQLKTTYGTLGDNYFKAADIITMNFADGGTGSVMRMAFDGTNMYVTDAVNSRGLEYVADYSPNFLTNSLVTKLYVDQAITGVTSGLTNTHVQPGSNITTGGTAANPTVNLVASPSINNLTVSGTTTAQGISGTTIYASQFFQMTPYTGANPTSPNNNDAWFYSAATGIITLNYRVGGVTKSVELS